jgi:predicted MFS family arabinose efflux permease
VTRPHEEPDRRAPVAVFAAAFLFNLGQGVLRPSLPLYLQGSFGANYRMVTLIPVVFGAGKWAASLPTGYLLERFGRRLMIWGLLLIGFVDVASVVTSRFVVFLALRALGGAGWAMFATVATTAMVKAPNARGRGRAVSVLLMCETAGLLVGTAGGGFLYERVAAASPFVFEAACVLAAALAVGRWTHRRCRPTSVPTSSPVSLRKILRAPGLMMAATTNAVLIAIQTGVLVFLFPLYLANRASVGPGAVGLIVSLSVCGRLLALWLGGDASDRWGRARVLVPGLLIYAALLGGLTFATHPTWLGLFSLAIGATAGVVAPVPTALIGDVVPPAWHGVAIGWLRTVTDAGQIAGPLVMGAVADAFDLSAPFVLAAGMLLLIGASWSHPGRERSRPPRA